MCACVHMSVCACVCVHVHLCVRIWVYLNVFVCVSMHVQLCTCYVTVVLTPSWLMHMQMSLCSAHAHMHAFPDTALLVTARGEFLSVYCTWYSVSTCCHDDPFCTTEEGPIESKRLVDLETVSCAVCTLKNSPLCHT